MSILDKYWSLKINRFKKKKLKNYKSVEVTIYGDIGTISFIDNNDIEIIIDFHRYDKIFELRHTYLDGGVLRGNVDVFNFVISDWKVSGRRYNGDYQLLIQCRKFFAGLPMFYKSIYS